MSQLLEPSASPAQTVDTPTKTTARPRGEESGATHKQSWVNRVWHKLAGMIPPVVVTTALAGLAWYGHVNDWKLPSLASLSGHASDTAAVAWCDSHGVAEDDCINCRPELIGEPPAITFCTSHGVHGCVLCNPALAQTKSPFTVTSEELHRVEYALNLRPRKENLPISPSPGTRIQFTSVESMNKAGIDVEPVTRERIVESIAAAGEIRYNETKSAFVTPQTNGVVKQIAVTIGDWVEQGDLLLLLDSTEVGRLKTELTAAIADEQLKRKTVERLRPLAGGAVAGKRLLESEADLQMAISDVNRISGALTNLGVSLEIDHIRGLSDNDLQQAVSDLGNGEHGAEQLPTNVDQRNLIAVTAPLTGRIVNLETTLGENVNRGQPMFRIVDTRTVWLDLRVPAEQAAFIELGQPTRFQADGSDAWRKGTVHWISTESDPQTRTVRVRAELANDDQRLRHETFGRGEVILRDDPDAIVVPDSAVKWDGAGNLVFVRDARFFEEGRPKFFVARSVRVGAERDGMVEIIAGVVPGEVVASSGCDVLRAQLLRANLGAGCTCGH